MRKRKERPRRFVEGPPVRPSVGLLEWLESVGPRVRLPVVIRLREGPLGIPDAFVGGRVADFDDEAISLSLDDRALGI